MNGAGRPMTKKAYFKGIKANIPLDSLECRGCLGLYARVINLSFKFCFNQHL